MLSFSGETLATAVRAFDRYGSVRIVIADPQLAEQKITGLFKANDPKGFATAVAASFGAAVASDDDVLRIVTKN
jgi:transmembrane sensor